MAITPGATHLADELAVLVHGGRKRLEVWQRAGLNRADGVMTTGAVANLEAEAYKAAEAWRVEVLRLLEERGGLAVATWWNTPRSMQPRAEISLPNLDYSQQAQDHAHRVDRLIELMWRLRTGVDYL